VLIIVKMMFYEEAHSFSQNDWHFHKIMYLMSATYKYLLHINQFNVRLYEVIIIYVYICVCIYVCFDICDIYRKL